MVEEKHAEADAGDAHVDFLLRCFRDELVESVWTGDEEELSA